MRVFVSDPCAEHSDIGSFAADQIVVNAFAQAKKRGSQKLPPGRYARTGYWA